VCSSHLFPANSSDTGNTYLNSIFKGLASLCSPDNKIVLYADKELKGTKISTNYTFQDYQQYLLTIDDRDLAVFVFEIDDKSPFLDKIPDENIDELLNYSVKLFDYPLVDSGSDILKYACLQGHILISLPTNTCWESNSIPMILINTKNRGDIENVDLLNIFNSDISQLIIRTDWRKEFEDIVFADEFNQWYNDLTEKNKVHVTNLIKRAYSLNFKGTIEQTKKLDDSKKKVWEWRGGSPQFGKGRIRILYKSQSDKHFVLCGFIKVGFVDDIYDTEIKIAETAWDNLEKQNLVQRIF
jgi:hypothetical protein